MTPPPDDRRLLDEMIAANMKRLRKGKKWSQVELANRMGCSRHRVMELEGRKGGRRPAFTWHFLVALCEIFECPLWELVLPVVEFDGRVADWFVPMGNRDYLADVLFNVPSGDLASFADRRREKRAELEAKIEQMRRIIDEQLSEDT